MLLVLTLLAVVSLESSIVEERMAGNALDRNIAFQAAESGLRAAEAEIAGYQNRPIPVGGATAAGVSIRDTIGTGTRWWADATENWWITNGIEYRPDAADFPDTENNPRYLIEQYDEVCDSVANPTLSQCKIVYRITAIAWGGRSGTVLLQSLFARRY
jgi:type IV pilus assembly protein PilX